MKFTEFLITTAHAQAQIVTPKVITELKGAANMVKYACAAAEWVFAAAIILSIVMVLLAGIKYMQSSGDPGKVKEATGRLVWAAVGVAVALIAFTFPTLISTLLRADLGKVC
jgi:cell division protein FtsW (lipid II flippase)